MLFGEHKNIIHSGHDVSSLATNKLHAIYTKSQIGWLDRISSVPWIMIPNRNGLRSEWWRSINRNVPTPGQFKLSRSRWVWWSGIHKGQNWTSITTLFCSHLIAYFFNYPEISWSNSDTIWSSTAYSKYTDTGLSYIGAQTTKKGKTCWNWDLFINNTVVEVFVHQAFAISDQGWHYLSSNKN